MKSIIIPCQMLVIGPYKNRVEKVISAMIHKLNQEDNAIFLDGNKVIYSQTTLANDNDSLQINLEILPCVATFDQYYNNSTGEKVTYLKSLNYFNCSFEEHDDGQENLFSSLAPYFDNGREDKNNWGIVAALAGCGIHKDEHLNMIQQFLNTMAYVELDDNIQGKKINVSVTSMPKQSDEVTVGQGPKEFNPETTTGQPIGPQRMAQFVLEEAEKICDVIIKETLRHETLQPANNTLPANEQSCNSNDIDREKLENTSKNTTEEWTDEQDTLCRDGSDGQSNISEAAEATTTKYACKICRLHLFDQRDLQDPPHGRKRRDHHSFYDKFADSNNRPCESIFLANPTPWMIQKLTDCDNGIQGKINCPKCSTKVGSWNWSGAQCSCGTWVTPAIQILASRVDTIFPILAHHS